MSGTTAGIKKMVAGAFMALARHSAYNVAQALAINVGKKMLVQISLPRR